MVARAYYPGTKFDYCIVLEGTQGAGKSSLARALTSGPKGGDYFLDAPGLIGMSNKDRAELLAGKWVVELSELSGLQRSEIEGTKAFISQSVDTYRAPYARTAQDRPRTCLLLGTTNSAGYLADVTGNRRFLPVKCGSIDLVGFKKIRDQLFAEAVASLERVCDACPEEVAIGHPLPYSLTSKFLTLPAGLRPAAAAQAEARVGTSAIEEAISEAVRGSSLWEEFLPDGRAFLSSRRLLEAIRVYMPTYGGTNLATYMDALGWTQIREGSGSDRRRGYIQYRDSTGTAPGHHSP